MRTIFYVILLESFILWKIVFLWQLRCLVATKCCRLQSQRDNSRLKGCQQKFTVLFKCLKWHFCCVSEYDFYLNHKRRRFLVSVIRSYCVPAGRVPRAHCRGPAQSGLSIVRQPRPSSHQLHEATCHVLPWHLGVFNSWQFAIWDPKPQFLWYWTRLLIPKTGQSVACMNLQLLQDSSPHKENRFVLIG